MLQRLTLRDWLFAALMVIGIAIAAYHIANERFLTGALVLGGLLLGGVVRLAIAGDALAGMEGAATGIDTKRSRTLDRTGRWNHEDDVAKSEIWLRSGIIAGFAATIIMSVALVVGYLMAGIFADQDASTVSGWFYGLTHNSLTDNTFEIPIGAYGLNLLAGVIWALIYAEFFERRLTGPGWWRGMTFSLLPWLLSLIVFFPVVGGGFFGVDLEAGPLPIIGNLLLHLIYGAALGGLYVALASARVDLADAGLLQAGWIDQGIAIGLAGGLTIGLVLGAFAGLVVEIGDVTTTEMTLAGAAVGVLGGLLVGPLAGLEAGASQDMPRTS
jgi:Family of unknown function (DUF6789)